MIHIGQVQCDIKAVLQTKTIILRLEIDNSLICGSVKNHTVPAHTDNNTIVHNGYQGTHGPKIIVKFTKGLWDFAESMTFDLKFQCAECEYFSYHGKDRNIL